MHVKWAAGGRGFCFSGDFGSDEGTNVHLGRTCMYVPAYLPAYLPGYSQQASSRELDVPTLEVPRYVDMQDSFGRHRTWALRQARAYLSCQGG